MVADEALDERDDIISESLGEHLNPHHREAKTSDHGIIPGAERRAPVKVGLLLSLRNSQSMFKCEETVREESGRWIKRVRMVSPGEERCP